jgi:hypothetical protein
MSALGQKQTFAAQKGMSALPPIATSIAFFGMSALRQKRKGDLRTAVRCAEDHDNVGSPDDRAGQNQQQHYPERTGFSAQTER